MLLFVSILKLVAEIALLAIAGQWLLGLLAGAKRDTNTFYQLFQVLTRPFVKGARLMVAFLLLAFVWIAATVTKISICVQIGVQQCQ